MAIISKNPHGVTLLETSNTAWPATNFYIRDEDKFYPINILASSPSLYAISNESFYIVRILASCKAEHLLTLVTIGSQPGQQTEEKLEFSPNFFAELAPAAFIHILGLDPVTARHRRLNALAQLINAQSYLEIGVDKGDTFFAVNIARKVAVDPAFKFDISARTAPPPRELPCLDFRRLFCRPRTERTFRSDLPRRAAHL